MNFNMFKYDTKTLNIDLTKSLLGFWILSDIYNNKIK